MLLQLEKLKNKIADLKLRCSQTDSSSLEKAIQKLPESQQASVRACFNASKAKGKKGIRYTNQWIYECLLLRIKSRKAYNHIRSHDILAVPTVQTLNRYMKVMKGSYGFNDEIFIVLKEKTSSMQPSNLRGNVECISYSFNLILNLLDYKKLFNNIYIDCLYQANKYF